MMPVRVADGAAAAPAAGKEEVRAKIVSRNVQSHGIILPPGGPISSFFDDVIVIIQPLTLHPKLDREFVGEPQRWGIGHLHEAIDPIEAHRLADHAGYKTHTVR